MTPIPPTKTGKPQSPALRRVARGDLCAGCGACAALAPDKITMEIAAPGYLRPVQTAPLLETEEMAIETICPGLGQKVAANGRTDDPLWGPYVAMMQGHATDPDVRFAGSSGGALSAMLIHLLADRVVDGVIQTAASPSLSIGNATVRSVAAADVIAAAGSRYAPSAPLADLPTDKRYAFVGKPCDVAALRAMQARDPALARAYPVLLSFFCAGVPSHTGGAVVLAALETDLESTAQFRYRGQGWPGRAVATGHDGVETSMSYHDSWGKILSKHVQNRCKICADGTGVAADIVCADAWEADAEGYPLFDEADGVSLIVARTKLGAQLIKAAKDMDRIATSDFDTRTLAAIQPGQRERRRALLARLIGTRLAGRPVPQYQGLSLVKTARQNPISRNIKNMLGSFRRALKAAL